MDFPKITGNADLRAAAENNAEAASFEAALHTPAESNPGHQSTQSTAGNTGQLSGSAAMSRMRASLGGTQTAQQLAGQRPGPDYQLHEAYVPPGQPPTGRLEWAKTYPREPYTPPPMPKASFPQPQAAAPLQPPRSPSPRAKMNKAADELLTPIANHLNFYAISDAMGGATVSTSNSSRTAYYGKGKAIYYNPILREAFKSGNPAAYLQQTSEVAQGEFRLLSRKEQLKLLKR